MLQIYRILGRTVVTYPKLLDENDFYMALDMSLLIDEIKVKMFAKGRYFIPLTKIIVIIITIIIVIIITIMFFI